MFMIVTIGTIAGIIAGVITIGGSVYGLVRSEQMYKSSTELAKTQFAESQRVAEEQFKNSMMLSEKQYRQSLIDATTQSKNFSLSERKRNEYDYKTKFGSVDR